MLEDEEAIDYGEEELVAPVAGQDEVGIIPDNLAARSEDSKGATLKEESTPSTLVITHDGAAPSATTAVSDDAAAVASRLEKERTEDSKEDSDVQAEDTQPEDEVRGQRASVAACSSTDADRSADVPKQMDAAGDGECTPEDLLPGWIPIKSRSGQGEVYYYNEDTGESRWTKPIASSQSGTKGDSKRTAALSSSDRPQQQQQKQQQPKKKKKKKSQRARDAEKAKIVAAAAKEQQSWQHRRGGRDSGPTAAQAKQPDVERKQDVPKDSKGGKQQRQKDKASQGISIKGAAQRQTEPADSGKEAASKQNQQQRSNGAQPKQEGPKGKRKHGNKGGANDNEKRHEKEGLSKQASKSESNRRESGRDDAKRQRMDRDDRGQEEGGGGARATSSWSADAAPRDRKKADFWRPGGDSARAAAKYADSDRREGDSSTRDQASKREAATSADRRRADGDARERQGDRRDDHRRDKGRERDRERDQDGRTTSRRNETSDKPKASGDSDSRAAKDGSTRAALNGNGNDSARNGKGSRNDRGTNDGRASQQQRQRGAKGQPHELSSINSTHSNHKRQWGGAASKPAP